MFGCLLHLLLPRTHFFQSAGAPWQFCPDDRRSSALWNKNYRKHLDHLSNPSTAICWSSVYPRLLRIHSSLHGVGNWKYLVLQASIALFVKTLTLSWFSSPLKYYLRIPKPNKTLSNFSPSPFHPALAWRTKTSFFLALLSLFWYIFIILSYS